MAACAIQERLPASFKGFAFPVTKGGSEHGRRGAEGEFPFGEETAYADLGRKIRKFSLTAQFTGPNYIDEVNAFIRVCESKGPGELVHPTRGVVNAACTKCDPSEEFKDGEGVSEVSLEFVEAQNEGMSLSSLAGVAIDESLGELIDFLGSAWDLAAVPFFAVQGALDTAGEALGAGIEAIRSAVGPLADRDTLATISDAQFAAGPGNVLQDGRTLASLLGRTLAQADAKGQSGEHKFEAALSVARWATRNTSKPGAAGTAEEALFAAMRAMAAAYMARAAQEIEKTTLDAAMQRIIKIKKILDEEQAGAIARCENGLHFSLRRLEARTISELFKLAYLSPPIVTYKVLGPIPSLVAAHEVYGDARKFGQIEAMNPFAPPWAVGPKIAAIRQ